MSMRPVREFAPARLSDLEPRRKVRFFFAAFSPRVLILIVPTMTLRSVRFKQVDVFTSQPFKGNPLAVIFDADALDTAQMQAIARWTNLSETVFLLAPTDERADYRVRIFTTQGELPFAGHPTIGSAHAFLDSGRTPKTPGRLVQECGAGLIERAQQSAARAGDDGGIPAQWAFAAPPATVTPLPATQYEPLRAALGRDRLRGAAVRRR
jgi:predicted PhzF superfamily epimerase YddE/YHI9